MNAYILSFGAAAVLSLFLTRLCRDVALRGAWLDVPDATRKLHTGPIPAIGGVALLMSTTLAVGLMWLLSEGAEAQLRVDAMRVVAIGTLGTLMMLVGLVDDIWSLRPAWKLGLQTAVAIATWMAGVRIESMGAYWANGLHLGALSLPITVVWIVGITNAFNLLDGIDGLAAGAALFATLALLGSAVILHEVTTALILAAVAGATAAFLRYNFNPASIFLGDSGSLFLGFTISVLAVHSSQKSAAAFAVAVPIVSLGVPVLDTTIVVFRRLVSGEPVWTGDRRHIHHMLLDRGLSVRQVAIGMYAVCGTLALVSLLVASPSAPLVGPVLVILGACVGIALQQLHIPELRALSSHVVRSLQRQRPLLTSATVVQTMLTGLEQSADVRQTLHVLSQGLADSGFVAASLAVPASFAIPLDTSEWRMFDGASSDTLTAFQWMGHSDTAPRRLTTLVVPLFEGNEPGTLSISAEPDDRHQAALINWLGREIVHAISVNLARTADRSQARGRREPVPIEPRHQIAAGGSDDV